MRPRRRFAVLLLLIVCAQASPPAPLWSEDRVRLALPAKSMGYLPLFVALHRGFFKDEAIDIEIPMMLPQLAHNALLSGDVEFHGVADSALRLAARGAPIKSVFFGAIAAQLFPDGQAANQVRSASCAASTSAWRASATPSSSPAALRFNREGLDPQKDAVPIMIGFPATRVAALSAGSIDATIAVPPDNVLLNRKGFASCSS